MQTSYELFLAIHLYSLYASGFLMLFYLALTQSSFKSEFIFIRRIRLFLPIFYFFLTIMFFTGILLLALKNFVLNFHFLLMIISWLLIFILALFHFAQFKKARKVHFYRNFRLISFGVLTLEIVLLFVPYLYKNYYLNAVFI